MHRLTATDTPMVRYTRTIFPSYAPSGPNIKKNTMMASLVGGVIGVGYAVLKFLLDNRLRTKEEAEKYLDIPVFAEFPEV